MIEQGWNPRVEYSCEAFHQDLIRKGKQESLDAINAIFQNMIQAHQQPIPDSETATDEEIQVEKTFRMKSLGLTDTGIITMSDSPNFMLKLSEPAKEAIHQARELGIFPYHVVVTHSPVIGDIYSVLYVSKNPEEWDCERQNPDGWMFAYCYNASNPICSELGSIRVRQQDKGLIRIA